MQKSASGSNDSPQEGHFKSSLDSGGVCDSAKLFPQLGHTSNESAISTPQRLHLTI